MRTTMNRLLKIVLILNIICSFSSCHPIARVIYGLHNPRLEEPETISKYMKKLSIDKATVLVPKDVESYMEVLKTVGGVPDLLVYNKNGIALKDTVTVTCSAPVFEVTKNICQIQAMQNISLGNLEKLLSLLRPLSMEDSLKYEAAKQKKVDFTVFVTSAKYVGYLNKDHVKPWIQNLDSITDCAVTTYIINFDLIDGIWTKEIIRKIRIESSTD